MGEQDDLARWADDDLVRALRSPGTPGELAEEEQYVAAFREARGGTPQVRRLPRRAAGRLGAGGTAVVVTVALTSGMAAAYTGHLPDRVQEIAHSVIGAPAPSPGQGRPDAGRTRSGQVLSPLPSGATTPASPTDESTEPPTSTATGESSNQPSTGSSPSARTDPSFAPTADPSLPPTATVGTPGGMTAAEGTTRRAVVGTTVTLSTVLTAADGSPMPGYPVALQIHGPRHWRPVAETTTDASGVASGATPPVMRSARFRWHTDHRVHSTQWLVRMVPTLSMTAETSGATTVLSATTRGGLPDDTVQLLRRTRSGVSVVRQGALMPDGSVSFEVATPGHRAVYVVRLPSTRLHTAVSARVLVVPPAVASVGLTSSSHRVLAGASLTLSGTVRAADGSCLPGRTVRLQVRGPRRWIGLASATTDPVGSVAIATPPAVRTARYRLKVENRVRSAAWRIAMVPTLDATTRSDGTDVDVVVTAQGGRGGDRVVLFRRLDGRLVKMRHAPLGADGSVAFRVLRRTRSVTYVARLVATRRHTAARAGATVPGTG